MLVIQTSWWFLVFVIGGIFSDELDPECLKLVQDFVGVATPNRSICIIVPTSGNSIHVNVTKNTTPGFLYVENFVCSNGLIGNITFEIENDEYMDFKVYLPWFTVNKNCTLGNVGEMRTVFKSYSKPIEFAIKNMLTPHLKSNMVDDYKYENETTKTSKDLKAEFRTPKGKLKMIIIRNPASDVDKEHAELGRHTNIEMITWIAVELFFSIIMKFFGYDFWSLFDDDWDQSNASVGYQDSNNSEDSENNDDDSDDTEEVDTSAHSKNFDDDEDHPEAVGPYYMDTLDDSGCHVLRLYEF